MYNQDDMLRAKNGMVKMIVVTIGIVLLFAALAVTGMKMRVMWLSIGGVVCALVLGYGMWMLKTQLWVNYYKFMRDMLSGRTRDTVGTFVECSDEVRMADGVQVHDVMLAVDGEEEQLLFYWDDDKPVPQIQEGTRVKISSYGRFVREMTVVTEE